MIIIFSNPIFPHHMIIMQLLTGWIDFSSNHAIDEELVYE